MAVWSWKRSGWVNCSLAVSLLITVITSICSTVIRFRSTTVTHSYRFFGGLYPEIGAFNLFLYLSVIFGILSVILRYSYIVDQTQVLPTSVEYINKIAVFTGIFSFVGLLIIASFPAPLVSKGGVLQSVGIYIFIGLGVVFSIFQTVLTYASARCSTTFIIRLCLVLCFVSTFISSAILIEINKTNGNILSKDKSNSSNDSIPSSYILSDSTNNQTKSNRTEKYQTQFLAYGLEWSSVILYAVFFLSFIQDFQKISTYIILRPFITPSSNDVRSSSMTVNERV